MSKETNDTKEPEEQADDAPAVKKPKTLLIVAIALTVGLTAGGMAGAVLVGPLVAEGADAECACAKEGAAEGEHGATAAAKPVYTVADLVLNPAETGGSRYLVLTIAFSVRDSAIVTRMTERDSEVRDALLKVLSAKSVPQLSDVAARPALKQEVRTHVGRLFGEKSIHDVFFPQFVIQ